MVHVFFPSHGLKALSSLHNHYNLTLSINVKLNCIEIAKIPKNSTSIESLFLVDVLLIISNTYPITRLRQAHNTFTSGEESPLPAG